MLYGLVVWAAARLVRRRPHYWNVVLSFPLIIFVWFGSLGLAIHRNESDPNAPGILSAKARDAAEGTRQDGVAPSDDAAAERHAAFAIWFREVAGVIRERGAAARLYVSWSKMRDTASPSAMRRLRAAERRAAEHQHLAERLQINDDTRQATQLLTQSARELHRCITATRRVMATLDRGDVNARAAAADRQCSASDRHVRAGVNAAERAFNRFGGSKAFPGLGEEVHDLAAGPSQ
jgi:hypothetical protein